ncbi:MAG: NAD(P)H-dependent oxidoreductase [Oscillospiraceae bacterium]|nr:NAD(P)H-dependent oxidoreductase [Oscillospiraceae bacterium]
MKIVMIHGQNHKGSTWSTAHILLDNISCEKEVVEFFLPRELEHFCLGCYRCIEDRERCPFWEEKKRINDAVLSADLLIFTTPNYCMMPSAPMKAFLDLFFTNWMSHKPYKEMFGKRAVVISTAAGMGAKKAAELVADNLRHWCIPEVMTYGVQVQAMNREMIPDKIMRKINKDMHKLGVRLSKEKRVHIGIRTRFSFWLGCSMQKADWGASSSEKEYWQKQGWLDGAKPWK